MECHFFPLESAFWCIKLHVLKRNQKKLGMFHIFFHRWCHPVWVFPIYWKPPRHQHAPTSLIRVQNLGLPINLEIHGDFMGSWGIQAHLLRRRGSKQASLLSLVRGRCRVSGRDGQSLWKVSRCRDGKQTKRRAIPIRGEKLE